MIPKSGNRFSEEIMRECNTLGTRFDSGQTDIAQNHPPGTLDRQRVDKWLWHARVVRTRSAAAALARAGLVRVNGVRIDAASRAVRIGDAITIALDRRVKILKVLGFGARRGSADLAHAFYEDLSPPVSPVAEPPPARRDSGTGRPTKRDRRAIDRLQGFDEV
jgi:ribosome-associated heat shock protein Hsp15